MFLPISESDWLISILKSLTIFLSVVVKIQSFEFLFFLAKQRIRDDRYSEESEDDFKYFSSKSSPTSYTPFLNHMDEVLLTIKSDSKESHLIDEDEGELFAFEETATCSNSVNESIIYEASNKPEPYADEIISGLLNNFPELYAENITFEDSYLREKFLY